MSVRRDLFFAIKNAQHQADSITWSGTERGIRYQGEADGLRIALRIVNQDRAASQPTPVKHEEVPA